MNKAWKCPKCGRLFKNSNQLHSCVIISQEEILAGKADHVHEIVKSLCEIVTAQDVRISCTRKAIMVMCRSTFLAIKPVRTWVDIEFFLDRECDEFPVYRTVRLSKKRIVHFIRIGDPGEINNQLQKWLKEAADLNRNT